MKHLFTVLCICLIAACTSTKKASLHSNALNGTWIPVKQEIGGSELPATVLQKEKLVISDSTYTFTAESVDKGILKYRNGQMDIYGREGINAGKHFTAIYKVDNQLLTICYNLKGDTYPVAFETKSGPTLFLSVFKKE